MGVICIRFLIQFGLYRPSTIYQNIFSLDRHFSFLDGLAIYFPCFVFFEPTGPIGQCFGLLIGSPVFSTGQDHPIFQKLHIRPFDFFINFFHLLLPPLFSEKKSPALISLESAKSSRIFHHTLRRAEDFQLESHFSLAIRVFFYCQKLPSFLAFHNF